MVSALVPRVSTVWALAGDIVLCSWARHLTLTVPLSTQEYKWVPANCWGNLTNCGEETCDILASHLGGGVEIFLAASRYKYRGKLRQLWARQLQGFTFTYIAKDVSLERYAFTVKSLITYLCTSSLTCTYKTFIFKLINCPSFDVWSMMLTLLSSMQT